MSEHADLIATVRDFERKLKLRGALDLADYAADIAHRLATRPVCLTIEEAEEIEALLFFVPFERRRQGSLGVLAARLSEAKA